MWLHARYLMEMEMSVAVPFHGICSNISTDIGAFAQVLLQMHGIGTDIV